MIKATTDQRNSLTVVSRLSPLAYWQSWWARTGRTASEVGISLDRLWFPLVCGSFATKEVAGYLSTTSNLIQDFSQFTRMTL